MMIKFLKLGEVILFWTVFAPITRIEVAAHVQVFCTRHAKNGSITKFCCPGFEGDGTNCAFLCHNGCTNGRCVGPLECECNRDFTKKGGPNSPCEPITHPLVSSYEANCSERCSNGNCVDGVCICDHGWTPQRLEAMDVCVPQCEEPCLNGNLSCVNGYRSAPCICTCFDGFEPMSENEYECARRSSDEYWLWFWEQHYWLLTLAGIILALIALTISYLLFFTNIE